MTRSKIALVVPLLALALPLSVGMRGCGGDVPIGGGCDEAACGPALGAPTILCADGTEGGNTGRCIAAADGVCRWEFRDCPEPPPPPACTDEECGPPPLHPLPTHCERGDDDMCHWVIDDDGTCEVAECGPAPATPTWTCADGTIGGFTGRCLADPATGTCGWEINDCPMTGECTVEECGPSPDSPACTCADGSIGCNTDRCIRSADGSCGWEWRECPGPTSCGGLTPGGTPGCDEGYFCAHSREDICGAADAPGTCTRRPTTAECDAIVGGPADRTVCGCDSVTYPSECHAWAAGTSVSADGACGGSREPDCDTRDVSCDIVEPSCPSGQVPSQVGFCYGPCVAMESCAPIPCGADGECPNPDLWRCETAGPTGIGQCVPR